MFEGESCEEAVSFGALLEGIPLLDALVARNASAARVKPSAFRAAIGSADPLSLEPLVVVVAAGSGVIEGVTLGTSAVATEAAFADVAFVVDA